MTRAARGTELGLVCRVASRGNGRLYQVRFKSFPVEEGEYFLRLGRCVEAGALRACIPKPCNSTGWEPVLKQFWGVR